MDLGNVKGLTKTVATDLYFNQFDYGNQRWKNSEVNNLDEFNSKRSRSLPITSIKKRRMFLIMTITRPGIQ